MFSAYIASHGLGRCRGAAAGRCPPVVAPGASRERDHVVELSTKMQEFVAQVMLAVVGTRRRDGTVQLNPAWYEYRDGYFWLNSWRGSDWMRHIERDGDVTLLLQDPQDRGRWA